MFLFRDLYNMRSWLWLSPFTNDQWQKVVVYLFKCQNIVRILAQRHRSILTFIIKSQENSVIYQFLLKIKLEFIFQCNWIQGQDYSPKAVQCFVKGHSGVHCVFGLVIYFHVIRGIMLFTKQTTGPQLISNLLQFWYNGIANYSPRGNIFLLVINYSVYNIL